VDLEELFSKQLNISLTNNKYGRTKEEKNILVMG
jgi:hypothetical protein